MISPVGYSRFIPARVSGRWVIHTKVGEEPGARGGSPILCGTNDNDKGWLLLLVSAVGVDVRAGRRPVC